MSEAARIAKLCGDSSPGGGGYNCLCPLHENEKSAPSFHIQDRPGGGVLFHCRGGCAQDRLVEEFRRRGWLRSQIARRTKYGEWFYRNDDGEVTIKVERWDKPATAEKPEGEKDYFPIQPDGNGGWLPSTTKGWKPILYNKPELNKARKQAAVIFIVEGEKCADVVMQMSEGKLTATTWLGGSNRKWTSAYTEMLEGIGGAVLLYDNDDAGKKCMETIAFKLTEAGIKCRVMGLPGVGKKGDVYDWFFYGGGTAEKLRTLVKECVVWAPPQAMLDEQTNVLQFPQSPYALQLPRAMLDTDNANSDRFVRDHGSYTRWTPQTHWLIFDTTRYVVDSMNRVRALAITTAGKIFEEFAIAELSDRKPLFKWAKQSQSRAGLSNMVHLAEHKLACSFNDFDNDPWLLNAANGIVDLRIDAADRFRDHDSTLLISKIAKVAYDPTAKCPTWLSFLNTTQWGDEEMISFLRRAVGSTLTGITRDQRVFFVYGPGANGKSIFLNTILALLGEYGVSVRAKMFMQKPIESQKDDIGLTVGKRYIAVSEIAANDRLDEALVKDFSGGDNVRGRALYEESFEFTPVGKLFFRGNHKPYVEPNDEGIWRRLLLIPFVVSIPEEQRDKTLQDKLIRELPGILNWAIEGCLDWQRRGGLFPPERVEAETKAYRKEVDIVGEFIDAYCVKHEDLSASAKELFAAYKQFCMDANYFVGNQKRFGHEIRTRGFKAYSSNGVRYQGIALK